MLNTHSIIFAFSLILFNSVVWASHADQEKIEKLRVFIKSKHAAESRSVIKWYKHNRQAPPPEVNPQLRKAYGFMAKFYSKRAEDSEYRGQKTEAEYYNKIASQYREIYQALKDPEAEVAQQSKRSNKRNTDSFPSPNKLGLDVVYFQEEAKKPSVDGAMTGLSLFYSRRLASGSSEFHLRGYLGNGDLKSTSGDGAKQKDSVGYGLIFTPSYVLFPKKTVNLTAGPSFGYAVIKRQDPLKQITTESRFLLGARLGLNLNLSKNWDLQGSFSYHASPGVFVACGFGYMF